MADYERVDSSSRHIVRISQSELAEALRLWLRFRHRPRIRLPDGSERWFVRSVRERDNVELLDPIVFVIEEAK